MATIVIDDVEDAGNPKTQEAAAPAQTPVETPAEEQLPEKYRGKSVAEIVKMHEEAEKRLGTMGAEVGDLRKLQEEFLRSTLTRTNETKADSPTESTDLDDAEFFINPKKAIKKFLEQDETLRDMRQTNSETQQERAARTFFEKHPDAKQTIEDPDFQEWVRKSPVRLGLLRAANGYDAVAGDELFSTYKEIKSLKSGLSGQTQQATTTPGADKAIAEAERKSLVRDGTVPSGNAGGGSKDGGKPIFKAADLIRMKIYEPDRYDANQDEILLAYQEGRVRR